MSIFNFLRKEKSIFIKEDKLHAEKIGEYKTFEEAIQKLNELKKIPWDQTPNIAPCTSWKTCGRNYEIIEYDTSKSPWKEILRVPALKISAKETKYLLD